jgi:hypothetical protein
MDTGQELRSTEVKNNRVERLGQGLNAICGGLFSQTPLCCTTYVANGQQTLELLNAQFRTELQIYVDGIGWRAAELFHLTSIFEGKPAKNAGFAGFLW